MVDRTWSDLDAEQMAAVRAIAAGSGGPDQRRPIGRPLFRLGRVITTKDARRILADGSGATPTELLARHERGDWGEIDGAVRLDNERALRGGAPLRSAYRITNGGRVWAVTEPDRSLTTLLSPDAPSADEAARDAEGARAA